MVQQVIDNFFYHKWYLLLRTFFTIGVVIINWPGRTMISHIMFCNYQSLLLESSNHLGVLGGLKEPIPITFPSISAYV